MVVHEDQRRRAQLQGALDDFAGVDGRVIDRAALLLFVRDQRVLAVEEQQMELLDLAVGDVGAAIIDQPIPRPDDRPVAQFRLDQSQRRLAHGFQRRSPGDAEPRHLQEIVGVGGERLRYIDNRQRSR